MTAKEIEKRIADITEELKKPGIRAAERLLLHRDRAELRALRASMIGAKSP